MATAERTLTAASKHVCRDQLLESAELVEDVAHSKLVPLPKWEREALLKCVVELRRIAETLRK